MDLVTGADVLAFVGVTPGREPTPADVTRAAGIAATVNAAIAARLGWAIDHEPATAAQLAELTQAAQIAAAELWNRRNAPFGVTSHADVTGASFRVARDYLEGVKPLIDRHRDTFGIG